MNQFNTVFGQLLQVLPWSDFERLVRRYGSDKYAKLMTTRSLFAGLIYAQARTKESLRDIQQGLLHHRAKWYHLGIKSIAKSTFSDANKRIDSVVFEKLFYALLDKTTRHHCDKRFKFKNPLFALDATVLPLCLSLFNWAKFRQTKGGIKLHCLYNIKDQIPEFMVHTTAAEHESKMAQDVAMPLPPDSFITFDKGYIDFGVFSAYEQNRVTFVTRPKTGMKYHITGQLDISPYLRKKGVLYEHHILLDGYYQKKDYPHKLRLIGYTCPDTGKTYEFITNNFKLSAYTITQIYKARWDIELFFKWIKQNLKIKTFLGTSPNAVMNQIWVAMIYLLLLKYIKHQTSYKGSVLELFRAFSESLMERVALIDILHLKPKDISKVLAMNHQLSLY
jgi:hypothetical protein